MPKVSQKIIDSVFFLYKTKEDALKGVNPGGTGFVVSQTAAADEHFNQLYGVTNWHVACQDGYSVVSLNKIDGGIDVMEFGSEDWHFIPSGPDVAVIPLELSSVAHAVNTVSVRHFAHKRDLRDLTVGDDVFMLGLLTNHTGRSVNIPSARFGNISMLPDHRATVKQPTGYRGESFIIDVHSRTGFSGSPVFVYRTPISDFAEYSPVLRGRVNADRINPRARGMVEVDFHLRSTLFRLLGIHWAQFPELWEIKHPETMSNSEASSLVPSSDYVQGFSGMTCVIPAWEILEVLEMPKLKKLRLEKVEVQRRQRGYDESPVPESENTEANPEHKRDFNRLLDAAVTKKPSEH